MLDDYEVRPFSATTLAGHTINHDIYSKGSSSATVVIIQELPGIGPETISLANHFVAQGFKVVLPHLFGPIGRISMAGNIARVFCMRREFSLFAKNQSSPIVDWLKALCRDLRTHQGCSSIGVIGMCLTGNFAISMMADESVLAGVASQPSMPIGDQGALHLSTQEVEDVKQALDDKGPMLALRFAGDPICQGAKFDALRRTFNESPSNPDGPAGGEHKERIKLIELPGKGHSVLTLDLIKGGQPAQDALNDVTEYFKRQLH